MRPYTCSLRVTAYGLPAPQGSKRHVGNGRMIESSKHLAPWRETLKQAALEAIDNTPKWDRDLPTVAVHAVFTLPRPRSHFRTGKFAHLLRDDAPRSPGTKPDLDKLLRAMGDAFTDAGVWADDSRLTQVYATKAYPALSPYPVGPLERPGARITLTGTQHLA